LANKAIDLGEYQILADMRAHECSLRVLRLSRGLEVKLHLHRRTTQFYFVIEGNVIAIVDGDNKKLGPMESLRVTSNTPHALTTESSAVVLSISIPPVRRDDQVVV
jgi:mannose-6-phosphate isomerase-like protein (cupin superfamily)